MIRKTILTAALAFTAIAAPGTHATLMPAAAQAAGVEALVARGKALLAAGKPAEAQAVFEEAEKLDGGHLRTRVWTLRAWIAQGRINDTLEQADALDRAGHKGPTLDYLYGMAFAYKAKGYIADGVTGSVIGMAFTDAVEFLKRATAADPERFADAFLPLAESAWNTQELDVARAAAEKAVALDAASAEAVLMLGRVAFSQFVTLRADEARTAEAEGAWSAARSAFHKAAELLAASAAPADRARRADALAQIGWLHVWKEQGAEAAPWFGRAAGADPAALDYARVRESLTPEQFVDALEAGAKAYAESGAPPAGDASLEWWLGYGRYVLKRHDEAETAFAASVAKWPAFVNSWYYIALSRYFRQDYDGTIAALRTHHQADPLDCIASLRSNQEESLRILDYLIGIKASKQAHLDAAFLSELQAAVQPTNDRYWNNLGLFLRDEGEARIQRKAKKEMTPAEIAEVNDLFERAYAAYRKALDLAPNDPNYLNDTALMLHYHLDRDLDQALAWYAKALECAEIELARKDLSSQMRSERELARRDAGNNRRMLEKLLERRRKAAETPPEPKPEPRPEPRPEPQPQ